MIEEKVKNAIRNIPDFPKQGINFKDITPLLRDPSLCAEIVDFMAESLKDKKLDTICGIESRGFLFGFALAAKMKLPFVLIRKAGKLPFKKIRYQYSLEYGDAVMELQEEDIEKDSNVLIHDDLLATGGTAEAAARLIEMQGGKVAGFCFLIEISELGGKQRLLQHSEKVTSLVKY